jgi:hypothetical protein
LLRWFLVSAELRLAKDAFFEHKRKFSPAYPAHLRHRVCPSGWSGIPGCIRHQFSTIKTDPAPRPEKLTSI